MSIQVKVSSFDDHIIVFNSGKNTFQIDPKSLTVMLGTVPIDYKLLHKGFDAIYEQQNGSNKDILKIQISEEFYTIQIYEIDTKSTFLKIKAKKIDNKNPKIKDIKLKSLLYYDTRNPVEIKDKGLLIGQIVIVDKINKLNYLNSTENDFKSKSNYTKLLHKGEIDHISGINELCIFTQNQKWMTIPEFLDLNKIGLDVPFKKYMNKPVEVIEIDGMNFIKITKLNSDLRLIPNESADISENNQPHLKFDKSLVNKRVQLTQLNLSSDKRFSDWFISPPCLNNQLASVVGLAIYEQLFRFKSDEKYINFINKKMINNNTWKFFQDHQLPKDFKNHQKFLTFLTSNVDLLQKIGQEFVSNISSPNLLRTIQEISNNTGFCIHFHDFTEKLEEFKLMPIDEKLESKPLIKLGRFFDKYFILYSADQMKADGYDRKSKSSNDIDPNLPNVYPFYINLKQVNVKVFEDFLKKIKEKITQLGKYVKDKASGKPPDPNINYSLSDDLLNLQAGLKGDSISLSASVIQDFNEIRLDEIAYFAGSSSKKQVSCCECGQNFDEKGNNFVKFQCSHVYESNHLKILSQHLQNPLNFCVICYYIKAQQYPRVN